MKSICVFILIFIVQLLSAQINDSLSDNLLYELDKSDIPALREADKHFNDLDYLIALPIYDKLYNKYNKNTYLGFLLGSCCTFEMHNYNKAEELITKAKNLKPYLQDYCFFYGKSLFVVEKFVEAKIQFEDYLKNPVPNKIKEYVKQQIEECDNNISSQSKITAVKIKNLGNKINTTENEYSPVFPGDESFMVYTYRGDKSIGGKQKLPGKKSENGIYFEDIYISYKDSTGQYQKGVPIPGLNSKTHESASYITRDGQKLYLYKNINGSGEIYFSKKVNGNWTKPERLNGICSSSWEGSCCFSPDEKTIYFSSDRKGGLGGRDIWKSKLLNSGQWEKPINLGEPINTSSDEDSPFITHDGKLMYFSSNDGKKSIGGYDIFKSEIKDDKFSTPENIGKPLNTIQDDKYLVISPDGKKAYYSSEHGDGIGQQDIYEIDRSKFEKPVSLILVNGIVSHKGKPVEAKVFANSLINKDYYSGEFTSEASTGKYFVSLPGKSSYELIFEYNNIKAKKNVSAPLMDTLARLELNVEIVAEDTLPISQTKQPIDSINIKQDISIAEFLKLYGDKNFANTEFKIQIAAYKMADNFNYARLIGHPILEREDGTDGITRFTVGNYETCNKANAALNNVVRSVIPDAFIIAYKNNKRVRLSELLNP